MTIDELTAGREAYAAQDWAAAHDHLKRADQTTLDAEDLRALSTTAYLVGDHHAAIEALQQAHSVNLAAGDQRAAARDAQ
ncbi:MAG: helix-turn-helix transcriptional regulator, partial [Actinomycetales bacterium]|nr:helix-turn-helix transcriptional regulator [Actinomycetales bacterium]